MSSNGLLNGVSEGLKLGLQGFVGERERRDKKAIAEQELESKKATIANMLAKEKFDQQQARSGLLRDNYKPLAAGAQAPEGSFTTQLGDETFSYDPSEVQKNKVEVARASAQAQNEVKTTQEGIEYAGKTKIPGYVLQPGYKPRVEEVDKFRAMKGTTDRITKLSNEMEQALKASGPTIVPGKQKATLARLGTALVLELKEAQRLGALSGPDANLLAQQLGDPTSIWDLAQKGGVNTAEQYIGNLQGIRQTTNSGLNVEARNLGFEPEKMAPKGLISTQTKPSPIAPKLSPEDEQALQWANAHPKDPKAIQIKKHLGR